MTPERICHRTTIVLDDDLLAEARRLTGTTQNTALVRAALGALIERESARRRSPGGSGSTSSRAGKKRAVLGRAVR